MSFQENLDKILVKHQDLSDKLSTVLKGNEFIKYSREYSDLEVVVNRINSYNKAVKDLNETKEFMNVIPTIELEYKSL